MLSSYGVALTPSTGSANRRYKRDGDKVNKCIDKDAELGGCCGSDISASVVSPRKKELAHILTLVSFTILVAIDMFPWDNLCVYVIAREFLVSAIS
jgi:hypothetical protein